MTLLLLLFLHHVGDVWAQPSWLIANKKIHPFAIYEHAAVWTGIVSIGLHFLGILVPWKVAFLLIGHFVIDWLRYKRADEYNWIYPDQLAHYVQVLVVWL